MKIVLASNGFPPNQIGGAELRAYRTALGLKRRGHDVQVVTVDDLNCHVAGLSIRVEELDGLHITRLSFDKSKVPKWQYNNSLIGGYLKNRLKHDPPDLVHLISGARISGSATEAARYAGSPVVVTLTEYYWICPRNTLRRSNGNPCRCPADHLECVLCLPNKQLNEKLCYPLLNRVTRGLYGKILLFASKSEFLRKKFGVPSNFDYVRRWRRYLRKTIKQSNKLIAPSKFLRNMYISAGIPEQLIVFCRQGLDQTLWDSDVLEQYRGPLRFGYVGQIVPHKGLYILIQAFLRLTFSTKKVRLNVFGELDERSSYGKRLKELVGNDELIHFAGAFDNRQIPRVFNEIDVLIVPSVCYENSPNVILEAFACKTPVIASHSSGMAELVMPGISGDLFPVGDIGGLSNIMSRVVKEPLIIDRWRERLPRIKLIDEEIAELEQIYASIIQ